MTDEHEISLSNETPPEATNKLLADVYGMSDRRTVRVRFISGVTVALFIIVMIGLGETSYLESGVPVVIALIGTIGLGAWVWSAAEAREVRKLEALAACKDLRSVGAFLLTVNSGSSRARTIVKNALLGLLPGMREVHSDLLGLRQREALNTLLYVRSSELSLAALSTIEQVGDGTALPYLTSMAAGRSIPVLLRDRQAEVQQRAARAVEVIRTRIEIRNRSNVLLRASQIPDTSAERLVRPATNPPLVDAGELLRPEGSLGQDSLQKEDHQ